MSFWDVLAAEFRKARTLPSLSIAIGVSCALMVLYGLASAPGARRILVERPPNAVEGLTAPMAGTHLLGNMAFVPVISAVLIVASEYAGRQLTTSALAAPRRGWFALAKLIVVAWVALLQAVFASSVIAGFWQTELGGHSVFATGEVGELVRRLVLGCFAWVLLGILCASVALIVRSQIIVMAGLVLFTTLGPFPIIFTRHFQYMPVVSGSLMYAPEYMLDLPDPVTLTFPQATAVSVLWSLVLAIAAFIVFRRRDIGVQHMVLE